MENSLKHLAEFEKILTHYAISETSKKVLTATKLALMVGPSSVGRNAIIRELVHQGGYRFLVSDTTRAKRINDGVPEQNGVEYWFKSEEEVFAAVKAGELIAPAIIHAQQVSGISVHEFEKARDQRLVGITDIETVGVDDIVAVKPDAFPIFVLPPSFKEWQKRLHKRGTMTKAEHCRRMKSAVGEFQHALEVGYYHFIINDDLSHATAQVNAVTAGRLDRIAERAGRDLAASLLKDTQAYLAKAGTLD